MCVLEMPFRIYQPKSKKSMRRHLKTMRRKYEKYSFSLYSHMRRKFEKVSWQKMLPLPGYAHVKFRHRSEKTPKKSGELQFCTRVHFST